MSDNQQQRYRVVERLASGGMAEVFLAESAGIEGFKKNVAIKRVLPHLTEKKRFISMFLDEARLSAHLSHSNVAQVFDIGVGDNTYFIVMEYVDGADLKTVIEHQRKAGQTLPVEAACLVAIKICEGLSYAHELKNNEGQPLRIVHRDMSPPNVLITKHGEVKIVDFGLAKASSQLEKSEAGIIKGKFSYLSPEAALGQEVDHRTDIFAVGIILWEMLAGRRLFMGDTDFATVKQVQEAVVQPLSQLNKSVPPSLDRILARALAREPSERYGSARDLGQDLTEFLYKFGKPISAFDLAELVRSATSKRKKAPPEKGSIIDRLIEEALIQFTSLQDERDRPGHADLSQPLSIGGFEKLDTFTDSLIDDLGLGAIPPAASSVPKGEVGNLAALEEDDDAPPSDSARAPRPVPAPAPSSGRGLAAPSVATFAVERPAEAPVPAGGGAVKALLVVVVLAVLAAGAYFGGLIPH